MLNKLKTSGLGCHLGHIFAGALTYADDIILLTHSKSALNGMLSIARDCATSLDLQFNGTKSQYLVFTRTKITIIEGSICFCG